MVESMTTIPRSLIKTRNRCSGFIVIPRKCYIMETEKELVFFLFFPRWMVSPAPLIAVNLQHPPTFLISPAGRWGKALSSGTSLQLLIGTRRVREHAESHVFVMWKADSDSQTNGLEFSSGAVWCKSAARTVVQRFNDGWCAHTTFYQTDQSTSKRKFRTRFRCLETLFIETLLDPVILHVSNARLAVISGHS